MQIGELKPVISEKATDAIKLNRYTFLVKPEVNKIMVKQYLKQRFNVDAIEVNSASYKGKKRRRGKTTGQEPRFKKIFVDLKEGQVIKDFKEVYEG